MYTINRFNAALAGAALGFSALLLTWRLLALTKVGGGEFQHADWLINYSSGIIRRGISGEIFLSLAQALQVSPLVLVSLVQGALTLVLILAIFVKGLGVGMPDRVILLLLSPALVLFWINDTTGAYRKELLGLACFLPLLFPAANGRTATVATLVLYAIASLFHEANLFFAPALTFALYLRLGRAAVVPGALLWGIGLAAAAFAVIYSRVPETGAMCQRILDAGLDERLCHGIFPWLEDGFDGTASAVEEIVLNRVNLFIVVLMMTLLLAPAVWIGWPLLGTNWERVSFLIAAGAFFALYPIATDWSRWLFLQVWSMTFLIMIMAETRNGIADPVPRPVFALLISFNLGVGIDQIAPTPLAGFIYNVFGSLENFLG